MSLNPREVARLFVRLRRKGADTWNPDSVTLGGAPDVALFAMRALTIEANARDSAATTVTAVATTPRTALRARRINSVVRELIADAKSEIVVLGYELSDPGVIRQLAGRAALGVRVDLVLDPVQSSLEAIARQWPRGAGVARVWTPTQGDGGKPMRLHAKALIADGHKALIGSANLTRSGLRLNLELGVHLEGAAVKAMRRYVQELIDRRLILEAGTVGMPL